MHAKAIFVATIAVVLSLASKSIWPSDPSAMGMRSDAAVVFHDHGMSVVRDGTPFHRPYGFFDNKPALARQISFHLPQDFHGPRA